MFTTITKTAETSGARIQRIVIAATTTALAIGLLSVGVTSASEDGSADAIRHHCKARCV
jgi:hypothetical protein